MNIFSCLASFIETVRFQQLSRKQQKKIIEKKQKEIINYAKNNSEYYKRIIPDNWEKLEDIPPTTKQMWMDNFDDILTDRTINYNRIWNQYKSDPDNATIDGKYAVVMTSGTTGAPIILLRDKDEFVRDGISDFIRATKFRSGIPIITKRHYTIEMEKYEGAREQSWLARKIASTTLNSQDSYEYLAEQINKYKPKCLGGYTSELKLIAAKCKELGYEVPVEMILCSGENLTELDKTEISKAFPKAKVCSLYASTEASTIATECKLGHLHINEDRVKIEPVDLNFNVLPYGERSDQTLLTVYSNKIQPMIRYALGDKIVLHKGCPCGCKTDWVEIQGRTSDIVYFDGKGDEKIGVSPLTMMINMDSYYAEGVENFSDYQIIIHGGNNVELRLAFIEPCDHEAIFKDVQKATIDYLSSLGVEVGEVYLSDVPPDIPAPGKKKRRIYRVDD